MTALAVLCQGAETCEDEATLCPSSQRNDTPELMPLCTYVSSGCDGITPVFTNQIAGSDLFGACSDNYQCDESNEDSGPFYDGIYTENGLAYCFYKAPVENNNACNGSGACQTKTEACFGS